MIWHMWQDNQHIEKVAGRYYQNVNFAFTVRQYAHTLGYIFFIQYDSWHFENKLQLKVHECLLMLHHNTQTAMKLLLCYTPWSLFQNATVVLCCRVLNIPLNRCRWLPCILGQKYHYSHCRFHPNMNGLVSAFGQWMCIALHKAGSNQASCLSMRAGMKLTMASWNLYRIFSMPLLAMNSGPH